MSQIEKLKKAAKDEPQLEKIISNIKKIKERVAMGEGRNLDDLPVALAA
jgi:CHASE3 domain sensor protein